MELNIAVAEGKVSKLLGLLTPAFKVRTQSGNDLKTFVCGQLGVHTAYFEERVQTIFLDSKPVDDVTTVVVRDGSILALSAAMPGLVGATFRKGGRYSWMRKTISHEKEDHDPFEKHAWVTVKLFNLVLKELGPGFLEMGVWVDVQQVKGFFQAPPVAFRQHVRAMTLDDADLSPEELRVTDLTDTSVFVQVRRLSK